MTDREEQTPENVDRSPFRRSLMLVTLASVVLGALLGPVLLTFEWSVAKEVFAGAFAGLGVAFLIIATKLVG